MTQTSVPAIRLVIPARTVIKVVVVGGIAAYFTRSLVKAVDDSIGQAMVTQKAKCKD